MKSRKDILQAVHGIGRLLFTTREIAAIAGSSIPSASQALARLDQRGIVKRILQGLWGFVEDTRFSAFLVIPFLSPTHRSYLSFISALHSHGVIGQIPQVITVASTAHSRIVKTSVGAFEIHQIAPDFFAGFDWHAGGDYLIASPEKALADCLYLASRRKRQFAHFPELDLGLIGRRKAEGWIRKIRDPKIRASAAKRLAALFESA